MTDKYEANHFDQHDLLKEKLEEVSGNVVDHHEVLKEKLQEVSLKLNTLESKSDSLESVLFKVRDSVNDLVPQVARLALDYPEEFYVPALPSSGVINLNEFKQNGTFSQNGEEGILAALYQFIEPSGFVIEFGAANGIFCSNTAHLWRGGDVDALLIESDDDHFANLSVNTAGYKSVTIKHAMVENIDDFTSRVADVISIDIDGYDYDVASRMKVPHKIVVIEYNPTVPPHVDMVPMQPFQGASAKSIVSMMEAKGYTLVACTKTNLFFLFGDHREKFETRLEILFDYSSLNYTVTTYDGFYQMVGEFGYGCESPLDLGLVIDQK